MIWSPSKFISLAVIDQGDDIPLEKSLERSARIVPQLHFIIVVKLHLDVDSRAILCLIRLSRSREQNSSFKDLSSRHL